MDAKRLNEIRARLAAYTGTCGHDIPDDDMKEKQIIFDFAFHAPTDIDALLKDNDALRSVLRAIATELDGVRISSELAGLLDNVDYLLSDSEATE